MIVLLKLFELWNKDETFNLSCHSGRIKLFFLLLTNKMGVLAESMTKEMSEKVDKIFVDYQRINSLFPENVEEMNLRIHLMFRALVKIVKMAIEGQKRKSGSKFNDLSIYPTREPITSFFEVRLSEELLQLRPRDRSLTSIEDLDRKSHIYYGRVSTPIRTHYYCCGGGMNILTDGTAKVLKEKSKKTLKGIQLSEKANVLDKFLLQFFMELNRKHNELDVIQDLSHDPSVPQLVEKPLLCHIHHVRRCFMELVFSAKYAGSFSKTYETKFQSLVKSYFTGGTAIRKKYSSVEANLVRHEQRAASLPAFKAGRFKKNHLVSKSSFDPLDTAKNWTFPQSYKEYENEDVVDPSKDHFVIGNWLFNEEASRMKPYLSQMTKNLTPKFDHQLLQLYIAVSSTRTGRERFMKLLKNNGNKKLPFLHGDYIHDTNKSLTYFPQVSDIIFLKLPTSNIFSSNPSFGP